MHQQNNRQLNVKMLSSMRGTGKSSSEEDSYVLEMVTDNDNAWYISSAFFCILPFPMIFFSSYIIHVRRSACRQWFSKCDSEIQTSSLLYFRLLNMYNCFYIEAVSKSYTFIYLNHIFNFFPHPEKPQEALNLLVNEERY